MYNGIGVLEVMLYKEVVMHSVQRFYPVHHVVGVIDIHLSGVKEGKLEEEGIVFCLYLIRCCVTDEEGVKVVIWAICKSKEVLGQMPKLFRESGNEGKLSTFEWEISTPSFLNILIFQLSQRAGTGCWFESMLRWDRGVIDALRDMNPLESVDAKRIRELVESETGSL